VLRVLSLLCRALIVMVVLAGVALVIRLHLNGLLSRTQLEGALADLVQQVGAVPAPLLRSRRLLVGTAFAAGIGLGWAGAFWWNNSRLRHRPLIMADLSSADMPFSAGIRHIRAHALPPINDDMAAMWLLVAEAGRGRLTLWRRASANTLRRVSRRSIRAAAVQLAVAAGNDGNGHPKTAPADSWNVDRWLTLTLLSTEMERLWPSGAGSRRQEHPLTRPDLLSRRARQAPETAAVKS
jgi:hypothetical protein